MAVGAVMVEALRTVACSFLSIFAIRSVRDIECDQDATTVRLVCVVASFVSYHAGMHVYRVMRVLQVGVLAVYVHVPIVYVHVSLV